MLSKDELFLKSIYIEPFILPVLSAVFNLIVV